jgi:hypothetical protein
MKISRYKNKFLCRSILLNVGVCHLNIQVDLKKMTHEFNLPNMRVLSLESDSSRPV